MSEGAAAQGIEEIFRREAGRVLATLIRLLGDFDLAEEARQEAFAAALEQWPAHGMPGESTRLADQHRTQQGHRSHSPRYFVQDENHPIEIGAAEAGRRRRRSMRPTRRFSATIGCV